MRVYVHTLDLILPLVSLCDCIITSKHRHHIEVFIADTECVGAYLIEHEKSIIRTGNFSTSHRFVHHSNSKCVWRATSPIFNVKYIRLNALSISIVAVHQPVHGVRAIIRLLCFPLLRLTQNFDWENTTTTPVECTLRTHVKQVWVLSIVGGLSFLLFCVNIWMVRKRKKSTSFILMILQKFEIWGNLGNKIVFKSYEVNSGWRPIERYFMN